MRWHTRDFDKQVFELRNIGLTYRQIGERLGVSKNVICGIMRRRGEPTDFIGRTSYKDSKEGPPIGLSENEWEPVAERQRIFAGVWFEDDPRAFRDRGGQLPSKVAYQSGCGCAAQMCIAGGRA